MTVLKTKRTYYLTRSTVETVRDLASNRHIASSQDAVVELAVGELARRIREQDHAALWAEAARDPEFQREMSELTQAFRHADRETWPE
jgi:hypothetical protein